MKKEIAWCCFALWISCIFFGTATAVAQTPEKVLTGEVSSVTGTIRFTGGTLFPSPRSFATYDLAARALKQKGVSVKAADEFALRLRESVESLSQSSQQSGRPDPATTRSSDDAISSVLQVYEKEGDVFKFEVYTGKTPNIIRFAELEDCKRLNTKCYLCSGRVQCLTSAITSD